VENDMRLMAAIIVSFAATHAFAIEHVATGVDLIPGVFVPNHQPDGNTVVFSAPQGLIIIDTGRHAEHTQQILDFATHHKQPIVAVINSHWHLDHIGGNPRVRAKYPDVRIYASPAIEGAMHGFLASYRSQLEDAIAQTKDDASKQSYRDEITIIDAGKALYPDEVVTKTATRDIAGRKLTLHLETNAVTAGDVWVFDPATRVLAAGDLVTMPVPFLDTACPTRWKSALDDVSKADFSVLIPGHGKPMHRKQFEAYRTAYSNLLSCSESKAEKSACIDGWISDIGDLASTEERSFMKALLDYYVDNSLRADSAKTAKLRNA
jgi:glyoxylase-like metal-dependent hydrolase (beta-lactamase superfamily II)